MSSLRTDPDKQTYLLFTELTSHETNDSANVMPYSGKPPDTAQDRFLRQVAEL